MLYLNKEIVATALILENKTNPNKTDKFPLDMSKVNSSLMDSIYGLFKSKNSIYFIIGAPVILLILFLLLRRKRRRR